MSAGATSTASPPWLRRGALEALGFAMAVAFGRWSGAQVPTPTEPAAPPRPSPAGDDFSFFYGAEASLRVVTQEARKIPQDVYSRIIADFIVPCVDVVVQAPDGRVLLVERGDDPMKGARWLIGGRMLKGETFFDTALRKVNEEVGLPATSLRPELVLGTWNTFFNTSVHVEGRRARGPATQTVNTIVRVSLLRSHERMELDAHHASYSWVTGGEEDLDAYVVAAIQAAKLGLEQEPADRSFSSQRAGRRR